MELNVGMGFVIGGLFAWLLLRPLDTFYKARLIEASRGCSPAEDAVKQFMATARPTCFQAARLLKRLQRIRDKHLVEAASQ